eukprot:Transcript_29547.p1 GENE.Transcript_29547~~Transcript_29547.p1  ORF type:complete len:490 (-),score=158.35 Transcript_29547:57-1481(-)
MRLCLCCCAAVLTLTSGHAPPALGRGGAGLRPRRGAGAGAGAGAAGAGAWPHGPALALRARPPRCSVLDELTEEAEDSWLGRFLPQKDGVRDRRIAGSQQISEQPVMFTKEDAADDPTFDFDRWEVHRSGARYGRLVLGVLFGKTTQRIAPVVFGVGVFSLLVFLYNNVFLTATQLIAIKARYPELQLPLTPFELTAPVLGLLLVFRTDTAYERFDSGAQLAWEITASMRSLMRRLAAYTSPAIFSSTEREAAADLIQASALVHGWLMNSYLRGETETQPANQMQTEILRLALGAGGDDEDGAEAVQAENPPGQTPTPYLWISAITLGASQRLPGLTDQERIALDDLLVTVSADLAKCEKLISTPIPLGYTRSSVRFLWIWITLLPFALSRTFGDFATNTWWEDKPLAELPILLIAMVFISFIFLSIEDIAVQIEEPFAILPLEVQHKWLLRDAEQTRWLMRYGEKFVKKSEKE